MKVKMKKLNLSEFIKKAYGDYRIMYGNSKATGSFDLNFEEIPVEIGGNEIYCSGKAGVNYRIESDLGGEFEPPYYEEDLEVSVYEETLKCIDDDRNEIPTPEGTSKNLEIVLENSNLTRRKAKEYLDRIEVDAAGDRAIREIRDKNYDY